MNSLVERCVARCIGLAAISAIGVTTAGAQELSPRDSAGLPRPATLVLVGSPAEARKRVDQLLGAPLAGSSFRSPSSMTRPMPVSNGGPRIGLLLPTIRTSWNSELPYSLNDGALWAGRGLNAIVTAGVIAEHGRLRLTIAPELWSSQNLAYALPDPALAPPVRAPRSAFASPFHGGEQSIDLPIRFGDVPERRLGAGQSSLVVDAGHVALGAATENQWWGPGIRNALLLSNNAGGFPHLFVRSARPVPTPLGMLEGRWIAGGLTESAFFDDDPGNDLRSIALLGVALQPRGTTGLVVGIARSAFGSAGSWGSALASFPRVFQGADDRGDPVPSDSAPGRAADALTSLFARWVLPASRAEVYGEYGRTELPRSVRDFLEQPAHSQGYLLGLQWLSHPLGTRGRLRVQAEATYVEQSTSYRFRPLGSWYTSRTVVQGYTERGQPLGAAIGPGGSTQWMAVDHLAAKWEAGAYLTRVRWLADVQNQMRSPANNDFCRHDVSLLPGLRGRRETHSAPSRRTTAPGGGSTSSSSSRDCASAIPRATSATTR